MKSRTKNFNVSTPSGFPEFSPVKEQVRQNWLKTIVQIYEQYGFSPIYTPIIERTENLLGKGGNPKEMYVLDRYLSDESADKDAEKSRALRFDHTVPFALYVARHFNELSFPFKRQAIGPVFRGERAQKGRFRQFDQCDIDVIGNGKLSILHDAQIPAIIIEIFTKLLPKNDFVVRINNRRILLGFFASIGIVANKVKKALDIVDDLEKLSEEKIRENFLTENILEEQVTKILNFVKISGNNSEILEALKNLQIENAEFLAGLNDLKIVIKSLEAMGLKSKYYKIDLKIARGLDYYTGTVFETNLVGYEKIGSICSGGRYDDLGEVFSGKSLPAVGISIGLTRLLGQLFDAGIIEPVKQTKTEILIIHIGEDALPKALEIAQNLRTSGLFVENYLDDKKLPKKFDYADKLKIPYVLTLGENEINANVVQVKNMETGSKEDVKIDKLIEFFKK
jgi:histidyl-tRNA synthetase